MCCTNVTPRYVICLLCRLYLRCLLFFLVVFLLFYFPCPMSNCIFYLLIKKTSLLFQYAYAFACFASFLSLSCGVTTFVCVCSRWYLGIQSKKDPAHVMNEVYKAMSALKCTWHQCNNYRVLCLWTYTSGVVHKPVSPQRSSDVVRYVFLSCLVLSCLVLSCLVCFLLLFLLIVLYCTVLCCAVLCCAVLYCTVRFY
jgi:hypothetical protein